MDTRKVASVYRLAQWGQIIQARAQSGQSIKDYCAAAGISRNTYFYWQRKLRQATCAELTIRDESETGLVPGGWARLEPSASVQSTTSVSIEINGCRVAVTGDTDPELLARVCRTLKTL